ncbi:MAG TPA: GGDEF domain-containing protein, partial [Polyangiaceae bacterium]|nr:GGDEF domain-containing protein [Polyangiaceae bacterium]
VLPNTQPAAAVQVGERILRELAGCPLPPELQSRRLTVSIGVSVISGLSSTLEDIIAAASGALKNAKGRGKHRVWLSDEQSGYGLNASPEALTSVSFRDLRIVTQPIRDLRDGTLKGRELFVRGPNTELEKPRELFEFARNLGILERLDLECLRASLKACSTFGGPRLHVNVLPSTLTRYEALLELLREQSLPTKLCLEVDEREIVGDPGKLRPARAYLKEHGILLGLDNVGFGRNALETIVVLKPDIVKVSVDLLANVARDRGQVRDLRRLVAFAESAGCEIIAQGVESSRDVGTLLETGIRSAQGFLWDRPD